MVLVVALVCRACVLAMPGRVCLGHVRSSSAPGPAASWMLWCVLWVCPAVFALVHLGVPGIVACGLCAPTVRYMADDVDQYLFLGAAAQHYYGQLERKHFDQASASGSVFTDPRVSSVRDLLRLAIEQRGSLDGHDHDVLGEPSRPGTYYVKVDVKGLQGAVSGADLDPQEFVLAQRSKDGVPPDLLVFGRNREPVDFATLVLTDEMVEGSVTGRRVLVTCFPGLPAAPASRDRDRLRDNDLLSSAEVPAGDTVLLADLDSLGEITQATVRALCLSPDPSDAEVLEVLGQVARNEHPHADRVRDLLVRAAAAEQGEWFDPETNPMHQWVERFEDDARSLSGASSPVKSHRRLSWEDLPTSGRAEH